MDLQSLIVAAIVLASLLYASWTLMPSSLRMVIARALLRLRLRWPARTRSWLERAAAGPTGCGCDGCDAGTKPRSKKASPADSAAVQPIRFHPPAKR